MMNEILKLVPAIEIEDSVLFKCEEVQGKEVEKILEVYVPQMIDIIKKYKGLGLAAPQVGIEKRFIIMPDGNEGEYITYFNPFYVKDDNKRFALKEACLSYGLGKKFITVIRYKYIRVIHYKWNGKTLEKRILVVRRFPFNIGFQHEIDHLNGITIFTKGGK